MSLKTRSETACRSSPFPKHERKVPFYSRVLSTGETSPLARGRSDEQPGHARHWLGRAALNNDTANKYKENKMKEQYSIEGVAVDRYAQGGVTGKPPIVMVHGGDHGSWAWDKWANFFCQAGYQVHALNWYNHGNSDRLPEAEFIKRSITDIADKELSIVVRNLAMTPIVIGHSMGGLASAVYASTGPVERLVLVTPAMPVAAKADPVPLPIDYSAAFPVFPYEQAKQLFFTTLGDEEARRYYQLLVPASAQAVHEATEWTVALDTSAITMPTFVIGAELDQLVPVEPLRRYANLIRAEYFQMNGIGHCDVLLKEPDWQGAADKVLQWLS
jgi:pimeloyl-ACP methyl ester carboxylesterase